VAGVEVSVNSRTVVMDRRGPCLGFSPGWRVCPLGYSLVILIMIPVRGQGWCPTVASGRRVPRSGRVPFMIVGVVWWWSGRRGECLDRTPGVDQVVGPVGFQKSATCVE
jgi:hypothetical protein